MYGVELGSGVNSPANSPRDSPRLLSPTDHVNVTSTTTTTSTSTSSSTSSSSSSSSKQRLGAAAHGVANRPGSAGETRGKGQKRAVGHERQKKREERESNKQTERLLSTASDSGLGVLGDFFVHATGQNDQVGFSGGSGSGSGSQGEETPAPSALANSRLLRAAMSGASTEKSVKTRDVMVQTVPLKTGVKFVQTDPLPSTENFKERYEEVLKEKKDLQVKLERSEDQKFKMQKDHKREVDKLEKKYYSEARKVW